MAPLDPLGCVGDLCWQWATVAALHVSLQASGESGSGGGAHRDAVSNVLLQLPKYFISVERVQSITDLV